MNTIKYNPFADKSDLSFSEYRGVVLNRMEPECWLLLTRDFVNSSIAASYDTNLNVQEAYRNILDLVDNTKRIASQTDG